MRKLNLILFLVFILLLTYVVSCNIKDKSNIQDLIVSPQTDGESEPYNCPNPNECDMEPVCLILYYNNEEFDYGIVKKALVNIHGTDCVSATYYCWYLTSGSSSHGMGSYLPWENDSCRFVREVCLETDDNKTYTGSSGIFGPGGGDATVYLNYIPEAECDFGGNPRR